MINEFDTKELRTKNFKEHQEAMHDLSVTSIVKVLDFIGELKDLFPDTMQEFDIDEIVMPLKMVATKCKTNKKCLHCQSTLFKSDLPQYDYVCVECDENFYECEVK